MAGKYMEDCYKKEFEATVKSVKDDKFIVLDETYFYPNKGGQPNDTGVFVKDGEEYQVVYVGEFSGEISHEVSKPGLKEGDKIIAKVDWDRRYKLMRMHTAAHVLSRVLHDETGAVTSGNQLGVDKSRIDFTLENFDKEKMKKCVDIANEIISKEVPVEKSFMSRDDAYKIKGFAEVSPHLVADLPELRVVNIPNVDAQPCGGTHLDNIKEIGKITFIKAENKGKNNRRLYYGLE